MRSLENLPDEELLRRLAQLVTQSRGVEADVVAHIGEVELRRLYAQEACSSMFEYCRRVLRLRENEAYLRITVARAAHEHPVLLDMLRDGRLHLSGIARLARHLTRESAETVLKRASGMSHREIRELVSELDPKPDVAAMIRKLPARSAPARAASPSPVVAVQLGAPRVESVVLSFEPEEEGPRDTVAPPAPPAGARGLGPQARGPAHSTPPAAPGRTQAAGPLPRSRPVVIEPPAPSRYLVRFTAGAELRDKLERLQALMRHAVPDGDLARIIDVAITEKLQRIEARRFGQTKKPRRSLAETDTTPSSRGVPAAVKRAVYARDGGRCAYRNRLGRRCARRFDLEFHHRHPFGRDGDHDPTNVSLMCRAHNALLAEQDYGREVMERFRAARQRATVPVDAYGAPIVVQPRGLSPG